MFVCHQAIGAAFGGAIIRAMQELMHGPDQYWPLPRRIGIFRNLPRQFTVNRYHSLAIERVNSALMCWRSRAWPDDGEIMKRAPQNAGY